jgi:hypothetical protein
VFLSEWIVTGLGIGTRLVTWSPEIFSGVTLLVVGMRLATDRTILVPQKYIILFSITIVLIIVGVVANTVQSGAIFAGLRRYFRYAPIFLLPIVYQFSDDQFKQQLKFFLVFALLQLPIAAYQRMTLYPIYRSGDVITGTIGGSGLLTIFQVCTIAMLTAFLVKRRIRLVYYVPLVFLLFLPTTINETTVTVFILPLALVIPVFLAKTGLGKLRLLIPMAAFGALVMTVFVTLYHAQYSRWGGEEGGLGAMLFEGRALEFLYKGSTEDTEVEDGRRRMSAVGRLDSVKMPFLVVQDPVRILLGNGIGNASVSFSKKLEGDYAEEAELYGADFTGVAALLWEIGLIGLGLSFLFIWMVFKDARALANRDDLVGTVALGWAAVLAILAITMFYTSLIDKTALGYTMWYLCGYIVAKRCWQDYDAIYAQAAPSTPPPKRAVRPVTAATRPF